MLGSTGYPLTSVAPTQSGLATSPTGEVKSIRIGVIDVEIVELARRAIAAEVLRLGIDLGNTQEPLEIGHMLFAHLFLDAVGAEIIGAALHIKPRLVDRIT